KAFDKLATENNQLETKNKEITQKLGTLRTKNKQLTSELEISQRELFLKDGEIGLLEQKGQKLTNQQETLQQNYQSAQETTIRKFIARAAADKANNPKKLYQQEQQNHLLTKQQAEAERDNYQQQLAGKDQIIQEQARKIRELENKPPLVETKTQTIEKIKEVEKEKIIEKPIASGESLAEIIAINLTALEKELNIELTSELKEQISQVGNYQQLSQLRNQAIRNYWAAKSEDIYGKEEDNIGSILAGGDWLENKEPLITENFPEKKGIYSKLPQTPNKPKPIFIENKPVISNKNSIQWGKYLTTSKS
ncbi:18015_t:CDS:2, partial [Cetraspora pellucida]